jgi:hypothetical protein
MRDRQNRPAANGRVVAGVLAVAVLAVLASLDSYQVSAANAQRFPDPYGVGLAEQRFATVVQQLPPHATLTYISDLPLNQTAGTTAFLAAQYALAPRPVIPADDHPATEWGIGNFSRPSDYAPVGAKAGFTMVADFGSGVILYRRAKP